MNTTKRAARDAAICAAFVAGSRVSALAAAYDLAPHSVRRILHAAGVYEDRGANCRPVRGPDGRSWASLTDCAAVLGVTPAALQNHIAEDAEDGAAVLRSYPQRRPRGRPKKEAA